MKFCQAIEYKKEIFPFKNQVQNAGRQFTLDYWSRDMFNFDFLEKDLGMVSPPYFVCDFSRKIFFKLYSFN